MSTTSTLPPFHPQMTPTIVPTIAMMATSTSVEKTETCAPMMTRENRSRPYRSVPAMCSPLGAFNACERSCAYGSLGQSHWAKTATQMTSSAKAPNTATFRRV